MRDAITLSARDARMILGETYNAVLEGGYALANPDLEGRPRLRVTNAVDALKEWAEVGSNSWTGEKYPTQEEASDALRRKWADVQRRRTDYEMRTVPEERTPRAFVQHKADDTYVPNIVFYNTSQVVLIGKPTAIRLFRSGKPVELRAHTETNMRDLLDAYGDSAEGFGPHNAHVVAIEVLNPDDEIAGT
jgi:hypothetical protein